MFHPSGQHRLPIPPDDLNSEDENREALKRRGVGSTEEQHLLGIGELLSRFDIVPIRRSRLSWTAFYSLVLRAINVYFPDHDAAIVLHSNHSIFSFRILPRVGSEPQSVPHQCRALTLALLGRERLDSGIAVLNYYPSFLDFTTALQYRIRTLHIPKVSNVRFLTNSDKAKRSRTGGTVKITGFEQFDLPNQYQIPRQFSQGFLREFENFPLKHRVKNPELDLWTHFLKSTFGFSHPSSSSLVKMVIDKLKIQVNPQSSIVVEHSSEASSGQKAETLSMIHSSWMGVLDRVGVDTECSDQIEAFQKFSRVVALLCVGRCAHIDWRKWNGSSLIGFRRYSAPLAADTEETEEIEEEGETTVSAESESVIRQAVVEMTAPSVEDDSNQIDEEDQEDLGSNFALLSVGYVGVPQLLRDVDLFSSGLEADQLSKMMCHAEAGCITFCDHSILNEFVRLELTTTKCPCDQRCGPMIVGFYNRWKYQLPSERMAEKTFVVRVLNEDFKYSRVKLFCLGASKSVVLSDDKYANALQIHRMWELCGILTLSSQQDNSHRVTLRQSFDKINENTTYGNNGLQFVFESAEPLTHLQFDFRKESPRHDDVQDVAREKHKKLSDRILSLRQWKNKLEKKLRGMKNSRVPPAAQPRSVASTASAEELPAVQVEGKTPYDEEECDHLTSDSHLLDLATIIQGLIDGDQSLPTMDFETLVGLKKAVQEEIRTGHRNLKELENLIAAISSAVVEDPPIVQAIDDEDEEEGEQEQDCPVSLGSVSEASGGGLLGDN